MMGHAGLCSPVFTKAVRSELWPRGRKMGCCTGALSAR